MDGFDGVDLLLHLPGLLDEIRNMPRISVRIFVRRVAILYCNFSVSIFIESPRNTLIVSYLFFLENFSVFFCRIAFLSA